MGRKRRLNVYNSDKIFNLDFTNNRRMDEYISVNPVNQQELLDELEAYDKTQDDLVKLRTDKKYLITKNPVISDRLIKLIFQYGDDVVYYSAMTTTSKVTVPVYITTLLALNVHNSHLIVPYRNHYTQPELDSIQQASASCPVTITIPIKHKITTPYDVMVALYPLAFSIDKVELTFEKGDPKDPNYDKHGYLKPELMYDFFDEVRNALSGWKMGIVMEANTDEALDYLTDRKAYDKSQRKGSRVW